MAAQNNPLQILGQTTLRTPAISDARQTVVHSGAQELVFAVVGHVGSGTSEVAKALGTLLTAIDLPGGPFDVEIIKARDEIVRWANEKGESVPNPGVKSLASTVRLQDLGDRMRSQKTNANDYDLSAVGRRLILTIRETRRRKTSATSSGDAHTDPVQPDGQRRAYILDSLRHPSEVELLRRVYQEAFILIGVVCDEKRRLERMTEKFSDAGRTEIAKFMRRDARAEERYGQRVADTFHKSDFFVDNSAPRAGRGRGSNPNWGFVEKLARLIRIVTHSDVVRPEPEETAMQHAWGAMMQSSCMSRQVGAALLSKNGNVIATGTNEVPRAGGGVYGEPNWQLKPGAQKDQDFLDSRCVFREEGNRYCSNTKEQIRISEELIEDIEELRTLSPPRKKSLISELRVSRIGELLEFSRAVHAEMDALLTAGRTGASTQGARLFVTTFPCHYCARHIISAGIDEVQFIEPYPKSQALTLHDDAITIDGEDWEAPSTGGDKVLFVPFSGVAPRMYRRAFLKDRELKSRETGDYYVSPPEWGSPWHLSRQSYVELESELARFES